jgi:hypothetical protein
VIQHTPSPTRAVPRDKERKRSFTGPPGHSNACENSPRILEDERQGVLKPRREPVKKRNLKGIEENIVIVPLVVGDKGLKVVTRSRAGKK